MSDNNQQRNPGQSELETSFAVRNVDEGDIVVGKIVKITGNVAFVDYGARSEGYIELSELRNDEGELLFKEGDELEAAVVSTRGAVRLSHKRAQSNKTVKDLQAAYKEQRPIEGRIVGVNKGGFEVRILGVRAFCPSSQFAERFVKDPKTLIDKTYDFRITEFTGEGRSMVVSRRALLDEQRQEAKKNIEGAVHEGEVRQGRVTQLREFGAFVDLGDGIEGLVHVSEISHDRVENPSEKLNVGDSVEVKVIKVEAEKGRVALSIKALSSDPWTAFARGLQPGQALRGKVERIQPFGAFINLAPGIDGLLHVSAISAERRIENPGEVLKVGEEIDVLVDRVDLDKKRIGLVTAAAAERRQPAPARVQVQEGAVVKGTVTRVESYGVFVEIAPRVVGLIPNGEMATERGANHAQLFPVGTEVECKVVEVDKERNRIRLSRKALRHHAEEEDYHEYRQKQKDTSSQSLGTFGDLLKNFLKK